MAKRFLQFLWKLEAPFSIRHVHMSSGRRGGGEIGEGGRIILGSWLNWGVMRLEGRLDWRVIYFLWGWFIVWGGRGIGGCEFVFL